MKQVGDLGNLKLIKDKSIPNFWPKSTSDQVMTCNKGQLAEYLIYNHIDLFDDYASPKMKPIVIHEHKDDLGKDKVYGILNDTFTKLSVAVLKRKIDDTFLLLQDQEHGNSGDGIACGILKCDQVEMDSESATEKIDDKKTAIEKIKEKVDF